MRKKSEAHSSQDGVRGGLIMSAKRSTENILLQRAMEATGKRIETARVAAGYDTMKSLAPVIEVDADTLGNWERGRNYPKPAELKKLCDVLRVTSDYILFGSMKGLDPHVAARLLGLPEKPLR